jgi:hypothetical protein
MRFLADAGISSKTVAFLRRNGHDAVHVRELAMQRAGDREVVDRARSEAVLPAEAEALESRALLLVEETRYRIRPLPIKG